MLIALASLCWIPFAAEIFLIVLNPQPLLPRHVETLPFGIRGNKPSRSYTHKSPDYRVKIRVNAQGIRADYEIPQEKADPKTTRIVVLGDSFGMGYGVNVEDTILAQTEKILADQGLSVEFVNLSVSGHGNAEELLMLENVGLNFQPDVVLVFWHMTDLMDNKISELYQLVDGELKRGAPSYLPGVATREYLERFAGYRLLSDSSNLYAFTREKAAKKTKEILGLIRTMRPKRHQSQQVNPRQMHSSAKMQFRRADTKR